MNNFRRVVATIVVSFVLAASPVQARFGGGGFGGGGRSFGGGFGGSHSFGGGGGGSRSFGSFGGGSRSMGGEESVPVAASSPSRFSNGPSAGYSAPRSGSFGGGGGLEPPPAGSAGSFGSRSSSASQSFGGGFRGGATSSSNRSGIYTGSNGTSTFTTNRMPAPPPTTYYRGTPSTYQLVGNTYRPLYYSSPWAGNSFYWLAPHPWYNSWNPFMPAFYFRPPYYNGYGYVPGGFNWLSTLGVVFVGGFIVWLGIRLFRNA